MPTLFSIVIVVIAVLIAIFLNYPPPPQSPLVYQWESSGSIFYYKHFKIFYKDEKGSGTDVVVCLHGFPTSSFDWFKVWPKLKNRFSRAIALDFLGMGFSDKSRFRNYSILEQATIVEELLQHLKVKSIHIFSHDYGDTVAQELLARNLTVPKESDDNRIIIKSVCFLNGGIFPGKHYPRLSQKVLLMPIIGTIASKFLNFQVFKIGLCDVFGPNTQPSYLELLDLWGIVRRNDGYRVFGLLLSYIEERKKNEERWVGALKDTKIPLHMIYGPADPVNPPPFADYYRNIIPKPSIKILEDHIGHYPQLEANEDVLESYFKFLDSLSLETAYSEIISP